jgi:adenylate cyclase
LSERAERRLLAILAADVVGYSRLIGMDEAGTVARLKALRKAVIEPLLAERHGRIVKLMGDGALCEFPSVLDAVECAVAIQNRVAEHEASQPESRRIRFRIGVNLGDVIVDGDDIHGDGVNIAARLEPLAEPGGVVLSASAYEQIRGKIDLACDDIGERELKNIERPVRIYRIAGMGSAASPSPPTPADRPSIVVLAFENMSADREQEYFADGIAEDVITDLSRIEGLLVIGRNSAFAYKGRAVDLRQIARELGVRHVLEGSVRKAGSRVRVTAQLIDGRTGGHLWAERYDRELSDIFALQDDITRQIVTALAPRLSPQERSRLARRPTSSVAAHDHFVRGRAAALTFSSREAVAQGIASLSRALELDPQFAAARALLSVLHIHNHVSGWTEDPEAEWALADEEARRAVELDPDEPLAHFAQCFCRVFARDFDGAMAAARRARALAPNFVHTLEIMAECLVYAGQPAVALPLLDEALRREPEMSGVYLHFQGQAYFHLAAYDEAERAFHRVLTLTPASEGSRMMLAATLGQLGRHDEARAVWRELLAINPAFSLAQRQRTMPYRNPADFAQIVEGLDKAGIAHDLLPASTGAGPS